MNAVVKADEHAVDNGHVVAVVDPDAYAAGPFAVQRHAREVQHQSILADFDDGTLRGRLLKSLVSRWVESAPGVPAGSHAHVGHLNAPRMGLEILERPSPRPVCVSKDCYFVGIRSLPSTGHGIQQARFRELAVSGSSGWAWIFDPSYNLYARQTAYDPPNASGGSLMQFRGRS